MLFSEPTFLFCFLPLLLAAYYVLPRWGRNALLAAASVAFYAAGEARFVPWLLGSVAVNYAVALAIQAGRKGRWGRRALALGVAADVGLLAAFKYAGFLGETWQRLFGAVAPIHLPALALPLGISFFTFHMVSYLVDVYRGAAQVRRNPLDLALYILFFPQLIAGPIVRYHDIAAELVRRQTTRADFAEGVRRFIIGLGKKMIVANTVAVTADAVFALPAGQLTTAVAWLGVVCYTLQIYFDFSGYSDMAIGLARMFGFHFLENFDHPYASASITEFWRRWHISLSRWFRDYLYIPLGGNRRGAGRTYLNLVIVFFLCGLWHGASWTFVLWGLYHGLFLVAERLGGGRLLERAPRLLRHGYALLAVMVGWVLFRAESLPAAGALLAAMAGAATPTMRHLAFDAYLDNQLLLILPLAAIGSVPLEGLVQRLLGGLEKRLPARGRLVLAVGVAIASVVGLAGVLAASLMLVAAGTYNPFIYFRF